MISLLGDPVFLLMSISYIILEEKLCHGGDKLLPAYHPLLLDAHDCRLHLFLCRFGTRINNIQIKLLPCKEQIEECVNRFLPQPSFGSSNFSCSFRNSHWQCSQLAIFRQVQDMSISISCIMFSLKPFSKAIILGVSKKWFGVEYSQS